jgi:hypothetical protein
MISMKHVVRADMRIGIMIAFIWGVMYPVKANLQGLLDVDTIGIIMLVSTLSMEGLKVLTEKTTFKTSTLYVLIYDVIFLLVISVSNAILDDKTFAFVMVVSMIPYAVIIRNAGNKFKVILGGTYPPRIAESVHLRLSIIENRAMLAATGLAASLSSVGVEPRNIIWIFCAGSVIQSLYSFHSYVVNYKHLV